MPQGVGKLRAAARRKFPRLSGFYDRYHSTITALVIILFVAVVAFIGVKTRETASTVTKVRGDVNVIKQQSSCSPKPNGRPSNPKQCEENFNTIVEKILTPLQACTILERGSALITIGGKRIPSVRCLRPISGPGSSKKSSSRITPQDASPAASSPTSPGSSPGVSPPPVGSGGDQDKGTKKQPSGSQGGGGGGSAPESGGDAPAGSPAAVEGTPTGTSPASEGGDTSSGNGVVEEGSSNPPPSSASTPATGPEQIVGGVNETVREAGELVCHINPAGIRICLPL